VLNPHKKEFCKRLNYEIISWIMGFGSAAEVIEPESLQKQIMEEHVKASKQYK